MESKLKAAAMDSVGERTEFTPAIVNKRFTDFSIPENAKVTAVKIGYKVATCVEELPNLLLREGGYPHVVENFVPDEVWKDIPNYEGLYQASNLGRVRSLDRIVESGINKKKKSRIAKGRILSISNYAKGYLGVSLHNKELSKKYYAHQVIATTFLGARPENMVVCHNNGNRKDNRVINLRWDTVLNNAKDKYYHNTVLFGEDHQNSKYTNEDVKLIRSDAPKKEVIEKLGISRRQYENIKRGIAWTHLLAKNPEVQP